MRKLNDSENQASGEKVTSYLVGVLECLYKTERLVNRTTDRQIINGDLSKDTFRVDYEKP